MKNNIAFLETDQRGLDSIGFLWEKLNEHHRVRSPYHPGHFAGMTFNSRKKDLLHKSRKGSLRIDIAKDNQTGKFVGYCISTINEEKQGEIDSIFIEEDYRRCGIGDNFMQKALAWMDGMSVRGKMLEVASGNEEVFAFYKRHKFYPRSIILRQFDSQL